MQRIREWMQADPAAATDVRRQNRSVVFFRIVGLTEDDEALGAQGIPLSAGRSIAVDRSVHVYGTPFFIEAELPRPDGADAAPFQRTMIAQDTDPQSWVRRAPIFISAPETRRAERLDGFARLGGLPCWFRANSIPRLLPPTRRFPPRDRWCLSSPPCLSRVWLSRRKKKGYRRRTLCFSNLGAARIGQWMSGDKFAPGIRRLLVRRQLTADEEHIWNLVSRSIKPLRHGRKIAASPRPKPAGPNAPLDTVKKAAPAAPVPKHTVLKHTPEPHPVPTPPPIALARREKQQLAARPNGDRRTH